MKTIVSGDITVIAPTKELTDWVEGNLILSNPVYVGLKKRGQEETIQRRHVQPKIKCYSIKNGSLIIP